MAREEPSGTRRHICPILLGGLEEQRPPDFVAIANLWDVERTPLRGVGHDEYRLLRVGDIESSPRLKPGDS